ncbi:MAG TPA: pyridoxal phosphate-dependent aminotransferase [Armatimonadota bacterium]|nr:pyridoxal phosphate-dependent aminotransferase [Armatimonadota bacterium]
MKIAQRIGRISPSATMAMKIKADELKAQGKNVLSFAVGEPDFPTPDNVIEAACRAMRAGDTKYTAASGTTQLKQAICDATARDIGVRYQPANVIISNGAKHSLLNIFQALVDAGDEVIIIAPYWVTYPDQIRYSEGEPVVVETSGDNGFQPDLDQVRDAVTPRTVAIVMNSPCNPTGAVYDRETIEGMAQIAVEKDVALISDEIYKHIIFDGAEHISPASTSDEARAQTLIVDGVAKTYAMTGWRIGWFIGDEAVVRAAGRFQGQATSNPNSIAQAATIEALTGPQESVEQMRAEFERRRDFVVERLAEVPGVRCVRPVGAFYAFPNVSEHYGRNLGGSLVDNSDAMCEYLLATGLISCVSGSSFGADDHIRLSFACSMEQLDGGLSRLKQALA